MGWSVCRLPLSENTEKSRGYTLAGFPSRIRIDLAMNYNEGAIPLRISIR
jgi:hypothetical protein